MAGFIALLTETAEHRASGLEPLPAHPLVHAPAMAMEI